MFKAVSEKKYKCDNVFENIPLDKSAVEQIFINMGISVLDILKGAFEKFKNETEEDYNLRIISEWRVLWKERAFYGNDPIYIQAEGNPSECENFQWIILKQPVISNTSSLIPIYADDQFYDAIHLKERSDSSKNDFDLFPDEWLSATKEMFSENRAVTLFRYQLGSGPKPSQSLSFSNTETNKFSLPIQGASKFEEKDGRFELGNLQKKSSEFVKQMIEDANRFDTRKNSFISRCIWGRSIQNFLSRSGLYVIELSQLKSSQKTNLKDCFCGFNLSEKVIDDMLSPDSKFYSSESQDADDETKAYVAAFGLVDLNGEIEAAIWCQNWESTLEGATLKVNSSAGQNRPYFREENVSLINNGIMHSLYIRAAGSRSALYKRSSYLLQIFAFAELSNRPFNGIISRVPKISEDGLPNFSSMSEQVQILGMQRAMTLSSIIEFSKDDDPRDLLVASVPSNISPAFLSPETLEVFNFQKEPPFYFTLSEIFSKPAFLEAKTKSKSFLDYPQCTIKTWKECSKNSSKLQKYLKAYFMVRIYPTSSQILGMYGILTELLKSSQNNLLSGIIYETNFNDGELTELEYRAVKNNDHENLWGLVKEKE